MAVCKSGDAANCPDEECTASRTGVVAVRKVASGEVTGGPRKVAATPPPRVFCKKRLQALENKGRECGKEGKETTKRQ
jgi:hypothetical protein